jgi:hypothetical protein
MQQRVVLSRKGTNSRECLQQLGTVFPTLFFFGRAANGEIGHLFADDKSDK